MLQVKHCFKSSIVHAVTNPRRQMRALSSEGSAIMRLYMYSVHIYICTRAHCSDMPLVSSHLMCMCYASLTHFRAFLTCALQRLRHLNSVEAEQHTRLLSQSVHAHGAGQIQGRGGFGAVFSVFERWKHTQKQTQKQTDRQTQTQTHTHTHNTLSLTHTLKHTPSGCIYGVLDWLPAPIYAYIHRIYSYIHSFTCVSY